MNKRIQELAEQTKPLNENGQKVRGLNSEYHDQWMEKFAELIVKECARVAERTGALNDADFEGEMIAAAVKEHFGVEQ